MSKHIYKSHNVSKLMHCFASKVLCETRVEIARDIQEIFENMNR